MLTVAALIQALQKIEADNAKRNARRDQPSNQERVAVPVHRRDAKT
jgi:hypothetical protein